MCWLPVLSVSAGCFDFSKRNNSPVIDKHYINGRLFCITRISVTSHKIRRNFSQDLPHLVTRYQASRFLASFYVLFCGHIPLPVENMPLPKNCPKNPSEVSTSPQTPCSWAFRLKDFFQAERFRGINSSARMPMNKAFAERLKPLKEKISVLLCVYKETGETTGRINKSS